MVGVPLMKCSPVVWNCILEFELKDQGEAGDHRTDCVRHIVRERRHIVFTLAYCQLGEEVGDGVEGGGGGEEVGDGGGSKNTSWSVSISPLHPELQKIIFPQRHYANQLWHHFLASPEELFVPHWLAHLCNNESSWFLKVWVKPPHLSILFGQVTPSHQIFLSNVSRHSSNVSTHLSWFPGL